MIELLRDGRPALLLFGEAGTRHGDEARGWAGALNVVQAAPTPDVPHDALLVRPDGYVAWSPEGGRLADALSAYFAASPHPRGPAAVPSVSGSAIGRG